MLRIGVNNTKRLGKFLYAFSGRLCLIRKEKIFKNLSPIREATYQKKYISYQEAKIKAQTLNLRTWSDWHTYSSSWKRPKNMPSNPNRTYKKEFEGIKVFLGYN